MDELRRYTKTIIIDTVVVKKSEINFDLQSKISQTKNMFRIPVCVDPLKKYKTFEILEFKENPEKYAGMAVIIVERDTEHKMHLKLNYEHFTHEEIFNFFLKCPKPRSFQQIGHILHVNLSEEQRNHKDIIGGVLLDKTANCRTVISKIGKVENEFRSLDFELIAGEPCYKTIHSEGQIQFFIDYQKVYWNSKLQNERKELIELFREGDVICDPFCGAGPVALISLRKGCKVYCNDINAVAIECLKKTIEINKLNWENIVVGNTNASKFIANLPRNVKINHFVFNLPEICLHFVRYLEGFDPDTYLHCYFFCRTEIRNVYEFVNMIVKIDESNCNIVECRNISPNKKMYKLTCRIGSIHFGNDSNY